MVAMPSWGVTVDDCARVTAATEIETRLSYNAADARPIRLRDIPAQRRIAPVGQGSGRRRHAPANRAIV